MDNMNYEERIALLLSELQIGSKPEIVANMFNGEKVTLEPEAVAVHDFIKEAELTIAVGKADDELLLNFDAAITYFGNKWPKEYYILLD
jgi:hypothetical protein